jgi:hypothetical protein
VRNKVEAMSLFDMPRANSRSIIGGGALYATFGVDVLNSTFSQNLASGGGAVYIEFNTGLLQSTFANNDSTDGTAGVIVENARHPSVSIRDNIFFQTSCALPSTIGTPFNISYPDASCGILNADPKLLPLADYSGPTYTMALDAGSPARRSGDSNSYANTHRHGFPYRDNDVLTNTHGYTHRSPHRHTDSYQHVHPHSNRYGLALADSDDDRHPYSHRSSHQYTNKHAC